MTRRGDKAPLVPVALSADLELRPHDTTPLAAGRLLAPRLAEYLDALHENVRELGRLADDARRAHDAVAEAAIRVKLADVLVRVARLAQETSAALTPTARREITCQEDLPDWNAIPPDVQERLSALFDEMEARGIPR